jgi:hypothetical protein
MMQSNESTGGYAPDRQDSTDGETNDGDEPDHDVPVGEQLTARQRELVGRDGGGRR